MDISNLGNLFDENNKNTSTSNNQPGSSGSTASSTFTTSNINNENYPKKDQATMFSFPIQTTQTQKEAKESENENNEAKKTEEKNDNGEEKEKKQIFQGFKLPDSPSFSFPSPFSSQTLSQQAPQQQGINNEEKTQQKNVISEESCENSSLSSQIQVSIQQEQTQQISINPTNMPINITNITKENQEEKNIQEQTIPLQKTSQQETNYQTAENNSTQQLSQSPTITETKKDTIKKETIPLQVPIILPPLNQDTTSDLPRSFPVPQPPTFAQPNLSGKGEKAIQNNQTTDKASSGQQVQGSVGVQVTKPPIQTNTKKGSKINMKAFVIGCGIFLLGVVGILAGVLYYFTMHPEELDGLIPPTTIKTLLKVFATIFFGFLFFVSFGFIILNGYRLATLKNVAKRQYRIGLIIGMTLLAITVGGGLQALYYINQITSDEATTNKDLVRKKIMLNDANRGDYRVYVHDLPDGFPLIGPINVFYTINPTQREKFLAEKIGKNKIQNVKLDCGNGQILKPIDGTLDFEGSCLYGEKKVYKITTTFTYLDATTNSPKDIPIIDELDIGSAIKITVGDPTTNYFLNDAKTEISVGKAPAKVFFDARKVFTDFRLGTNKIARDLNGDGTMDRANDVDVVMTYMEPKLQTIYFTIPELGNVRYPLLFRVEQSDVPICSVTGELLKDTSYIIKALCTEENGPISTYSFSIYDKKNNKKIDTIETEKPEITYNFTTKGSYYVVLDFLTEESKKGKAESDTINIGNVDFKINYDASYRGANDKDWIRFGVTKDEKNTLDRNTNTITLTSLPMKLLIDIISITPPLKGTKVKVFHDGKPINGDDKEQTYQITIEEDKEQKVEIIVTNEEANSETKITIPVIINQPKILGVLKAYANGKEVYDGESPFKVTLDASTTTINDQTDKIIYFSRDFGDGEVNKNTSEGRIEHTYTYNDTYDNGTYIPKVTITTAKGLSQTFTTERPIMVKKPLLKARISVDSHTAQIAKVGETVSFSIHTDGNPIKIIRDFGDGEIFEADNREGIEITHVYKKPGTYKVGAKIEYDNKTTSYPTIKILINLGDKKE